MTQASCPGDIQSVACVLPGNQTFKYANERTWRKVSMGSGKVYKPVRVWTPRAQGEGDTVWVEAAGAGAIRLPEETG